MNLYELSTEMRHTFALIEEAEGELTPELEAMLEVNEENFRDKATSYVKVIREYETFCEQCKAEERRLATRRRVYENIAKNLKTRLRDGMMICDKQKETLDICTLSLRRTKAVEITDMEAIPEEYWVISRDIDKSAIRDSLKDGIEVKGAEFKENVSLTIK